MSGECEVSEKSKPCQIHRFLIMLVRASRHETKISKKRKEHLSALDGSPPQFLSSLLSLQSDILLASHMYAGS